VKVAILAGGAGTRLSEETTTKPKPMVEIGARPMLWHIMKIYAHQGFSEFVVALGYKGEVIKDFFMQYRARSSGLTVNLASGQMKFHGADCEDWTVHLLDTGLATNTGGRVQQVIDFIGQETFMLTYGDAVADIDLHALLSFHKDQGKLATVTAVRPPARFGEIIIEDSQVTHFAEKPHTGGGWINGGFYVLEPQVKEFIDDYSVLWEGAPMETLTKKKELAAFRHENFWQCMDTARDVRMLEMLWDNGKAPWKIWP
jgi:glucose-1-phosphate cytidylyltransferase